MLTEFDDYLAHQLPTTIDHVVTSDRRFSDRYSFNFFNHAGDIFVSQGMAVYPNTGVMDGFALLTLEGRRQRNLRVSRTLVDRDRHHSVVGPITVEIVEPLHTVRLVCEENEQGFSYDVVCETLTRPVERTPRFTRANGRVAADHCHYSQCYRCTGSITIDGERHEITPDRWWGVRDRSWGIRESVDATDPRTGPARHDEGGYVGSWTPLQFDDCYLQVYLRPGAEEAEVIYPWDDPRPALRILDIERKGVKMDTDLNRFKSCEFVLTAEDGQTIEIELSHRSSGYIRGGGYGGVGDFFHGTPMGELHTEGEVWDLTTTDFATPRITADHLVEARWGDRVGYGIFEVDDDGLARRPYAKYTASRATSGS